MEINEQTFKRILADQREEYQRHLGVVAEGFESHVKLIAESLIGIQKQLEGIRDMVARNTEDIEVIKMDLHIVRSDLKEKVGRDEFALLENRISKLEKTAHRR